MRLIIMAGALALIALAGCNTVEGAGRDISGGAAAVRGWFGR
jgi:predicted small secreted protein